MRAGQKQQPPLCVRLAAEEKRKPLRPYDQIADLLGVVNDLPPDLAERTGERFAELLRANHVRRK